MTELSVTPIPSVVPMSDTVLEEKAAYWAGRKKTTLVRTVLLFGRHYYWSDQNGALSLKPARWTR
jgi:hypothetical protein